MCLQFQSTECEIFLSLLVKFMDVEKPMWQRCVALEVVHKLCSEPKLIRYVLYITGYSPGCQCGPVGRGLDCQSCGWQIESQLGQIEKSF